MPIGDLFAEAERRQREALTPEKMRDNPGFGKPLRLQDNPYDQGMGLAYRMLRNAGFDRLPWMDEEEAVARGKAELAAAVDAHLARLREAARNGRADAGTRLLAEHGKAVEALRAQAETLRRRILNFNLTVPIVGRQTVNVNPDRIVASIEAAAAPLLKRARAAAAEPGTGDAPRDGTEAGRRR